MIDTYFDRCDAASGYKPMRSASAPVHEDPRYFAGQLYATTLDRNVAEARFNLGVVIAYASVHHRWELCLGIPMGDPRSVFRKDGRLR